MFISSFKTFVGLAASNTFASDVGSDFESGVRILSRFFMGNILLLKLLRTRVTYSGTRLSSKFKKEKDKTTKAYQHDIADYVTCPENQCLEDYTGETA